MDRISHDADITAEWIFFDPLGLPRGAKELWQQQEGAPIFFAQEDNTLLNSHGIPSFDCFCS